MLIFLRAGRSIPARIHFLSTASVLAIMKPESQLPFDRFAWLTFDCYGTLIDWESGILAALKPVLAVHAKALSDPELLALYGRVEAEAEQGEYRRYREILRQVVRDVGERLGFSPSAAELDSLSESLPCWQPFPDTVAALRRLKTRYKLAIISNVDDDLFAHTRRHLGIDLDDVITAQQACSYKPSLNNFELALRRIAAAPHSVLHVAQSLYHDVAPAKALGISTVWVNRRAGKPGAGATKISSAQPDMEVPDLKTLAKLVMGKK